MWRSRCGEPSKPDWGQSALMRGTPFSVYRLPFTGKVHAKNMPETMARHSLNGPRGSRRAYTRHDAADRFDDRCGVPLARRQRGMRCPRHDHEL